MLESLIDDKIMVEWECTLECNFRCFYCSNGRNDCLNKPIYHILDEDRIYDFLSNNINKRFYNTELFLFGGEPFIHPKIEYIIKTLNELQQRYIIQTNFSLYKKILELGHLDFKIQVSIHREQIKNFNDYFKNLMRLKERIRRIDIMYEDENDELLYDKIIPYFKGIVFLTPVAGFKDNNLRSNVALYNFNKLKRIKPQKCEEGKRSFLWEKMFREQETTFGKPCLYKNKYFLFDPQFNEYNCSHRINCDTCPNKHCFLQSV